MSCTSSGVVIKVQGPLPSEEHLEGQALICRRLFAPPSKPVLFNFGPFERNWSWVLLPSPLPDRPFAWCSVKDFTLALAKCNGTPAMKHPAWCSGTWFVLRSLPLAKVVSLIWKIGTDHMFLPPRPGASLQCSSCQVPATIDHIVFDCAHTRPLWSALCQHAKLGLRPSFESVLAGPDRQHPISSDRQLLVAYQLAFVHIHYAWCVWWAHHHGTTQALERWERRVVNAYYILPPDLQELWRNVPYVNNIINSWKF